MILPARRPLPAGLEERVQPIVAALLISFIAGLAVRQWNALTLTGVACLAAVVAAVLYGAQGYM